MKSVLAAVAVTAVLVGAAGAHATTYTNAYSLDGATVDLSITTDGVTGTLGTGDITSWNVAITDSAGSVDITPVDGQLVVYGSSLSATPTALSFDFTGANEDDLLIEEAVLGDDGPFWCATNGFCYGDATPAIGVSTVYGESPIEQVAQTGEVVLAVAGVPEPAAWGLMLVGFGGLGLAMRSRRPASSGAA